MDTATSNDSSLIEGSSADDGAVSAVTFVLQASQPQLWQVSLSGDLPIWLSLLDDSGTPLQVPVLSGCPGSPSDLCTDCAGCSSVWCGCAIGLFPSPLLDAGVSLTWDGKRVAPTGTCGGAACGSLLVASPGRYGARMCGYAGGFGQFNCGGQVCVTVPFDYPSDAAVVGTLPAEVAQVLGGTLSGLSPGNSLWLTDGRQCQTVTLTHDGQFQFPWPLLTGQSYDVQVQFNPPGQTCAVTGGSGTVGMAPVQARVDCTASLPDGGSD